MKKKYKNIKLIVYEKGKLKQRKKDNEKNYSRADLIQLYQAEMGDYIKTRELQWKINLSVWVLLILATYFKSLQPEVFNAHLVFTLFLVGLLAYYIFVYIIQRSVAGSRKIMNDYLHYLNEYKHKGDIFINNRKYEKVYVLTLSDYLWMAFQITITFFILLIFYQV